MKNLILIMLFLSITAADDVLNNAIREQCKYNIYYGKGFNDDRAQSFLNGVMHGIIDSLRIQNKISPKITGMNMEELKKIACKKLFEHEFYIDATKKYGFQTAFSISAYDTLMSY